MTTATDLLPDLKDFDYDSLVNAAVMPDNKKQIIIDHIRANGVNTEKPNIALFAKNGIFIQDTFENYLTNSKHYSTGSFAKLANGTPLDFLYDTTDGLKAELEKYKDKSAFELGTFVHEAILEPDKWDTVVCEPAASRANHGGLDTLINFWNNETYNLSPISHNGMKVNEKKALIVQLQQASGMRCIDMKNALIVQRIHERWKAYQGGLWYNVLQSAIKEASMYTDDYRGLPMRIRPDGLLFANQIGVNALVSVKTTSETSIKGLGYQFRKFGYSTKEAGYQSIASHVTGIAFDTTIMIVLSTAEPFNIGVFILSDKDMIESKSCFNDSIETAKKCIASNNFPGWEMNAGENDLGLIDLTFNN